MCDHDSVLPISEWLVEAKAGDEQAFQQIWERYYIRLVSLARQHISRGVSAFADEEDVVGSALESFYFRAQEGRFPNLQDRHGLWKLLISITLNKARAHARKEKNRQDRLKERFGGNDLERGEPSAELVVEVADQLAYLLDRLPDPLFRQIALAKLEGCTNREIARRVEKSSPTIERKLRLIRDTWSYDLVAPSGCDQRDVD